LSLSWANDKENAPISLLYITKIISMTERELINWKNNRKKMEDIKKQTVSLKDSGMEG